MTATAEAEARLRVARGWQLAGRLRPAIAAYGEVVTLVPGYAPAHVELARLHVATGDAETALRCLDAARVARGDSNEIAKLTIDALVAVGGPSAALDHHGLVRRDEAALPPIAEPVVACVIVRNEVDRLPFLLEYHRRLGVERFLVVDNDSTDGTVEHLLQEPGVNVWSTRMPYREANAGLAWMDAVLRAHRPAGWCLFLDADELLSYPGDDALPVPALIHRLEAEGASAMPAVMVDLYDDRPVAETVVAPGEDVRERCRFFDRRWHHEAVPADGPFRNQMGFWGGARQRVFPQPGSYYLSKVPLLRYSEHRILTGGQHYTNGPAQELSSRRAALLHTKFVASLPASSREEVRRGQHHDGAVHYRGYADALVDRALTLFDPEASMRHTGTDSLEAAGVCVGWGDVA